MYKYHIEISFFENEHWWGGVVDEGINMPYVDNCFEIDLNDDNYGNQVTSFFISSKGRYFYSNQPIKYKIENKVLFVDSIEQIELIDTKSTLKEAYFDCVKRYFNLENRYPDIDMFSIPQYNTWIEMNWFPTQEKVLKYAKEIIDNGFKPGILMIDDGWQEDYGVWEFNSKTFPNPKEMIDTLHQLGFKVMLWLVPCMSPDSYVFRQARNDEIFYKNKNDNNVKIMEWWDGFSAVLDFTNPKTIEWLKKQCDNLQSKYGVDGFKFDGADDCFYPYDGKFFKDMPRVHQQRLYSEFASNYLLNEMRACFNTQGKGLAQRLTDKAHSWDNRGLNTLIPDGIVMSILGYRYCCPDMIGGGLVGNFVENNYSQVDQQLFVRYAQVATFFPMMQFSLAPWRFLNKTNLEIVKKCCKIHDKISDYIKELVIISSKDGSPIIKNMEFEYPNKGYENIKDQFMLGDKYLIAPVVTKDTFSRKVVLPEGEWVDDLGNKYQGNTTIQIEVPIERIPYFINKNSR